MFFLDLFLDMEDVNLMTVIDISTSVCLDLGMISID